VAGSNAAADGRVDCCYTVKPALPLVVADVISNGPKSVDEKNTPSSKPGANKQS
jgi:hypothetical protein